MVFTAGWDGGGGGGGGGSHRLKPKKKHLQHFFIQGALSQN